jgi:hypothetical protein
MIRCGSRLLKSTNYYFSKINLNNNNNNNYQIKRTKVEWAESFRLSREGVEGYGLPPLTQDLNGKLPNNNDKETTKFRSINSHNYDTHVTKLDNGLRLASEKLFGEFCTVGVIIDAGPRYEKSFKNGTTHFLEKLAFNVKHKFYFFFFELIN